MTTELPMHFPAIGFDVGGSSIKCAFIDSAGKIILAQSPTYSSPDPVEFENALLALISTPDLRAAMSSHPPRAAGLCLPGVWNQVAGLLEKSNNLPKLVGVPLSPILNRACGVQLPPCSISTDVHATALDLWNQLAPHMPLNQDNRPRRLFCLALGTGVGACVLDEGQLLRINGNSSGHFGQIDVTAERDVPVPIAADGGVGTLEEYWSAASVRAVLHAHQARGLPSVLERTLARALRIAHAIYRPDRIVLAGGTALAIASYLEQIRNATKLGCSSIARQHCELSLASDAFHAARGMAWLSAQTTTCVR